MDGRITIRGLDDFRRDLKKAGGPKLSKQIQVGGKKVAEHVTGKGRTSLSGHHPKGGAASRGLKPRATQRGAGLSLLGSNKFIRAHVLGTQVHWVGGRPVSAASLRRRVFPQWVGRSWNPEQLHVIGPILKNDRAEHLEMWITEVQKAFDNAFPD